jgi:hypothetical protein
MKTIRIKIYKFEELTQEAQSKAIEQFRDRENVYLGFFNDNAIEQINEVGFYDDVKLQYSLGCSQGDGLSFSCKRIEWKTIEPLFLEVLGKDKEKTAKLIFEHCSFICTGNDGRYCYASKNDIDFTFENYNREYENINEVVGNVLTKIENKYLELCKELEKQGYSEIEYQQSDEAIKETILANDYDFLKDGTQY